jgi:hypothetical protein
MHRKIAILNGFIVSLMLYSANASALDDTSLTGLFTPNFLRLVGDFATANDSVNISLKNNTLDSIEFSKVTVVDGDGIPFITSTPADGVFSTWIDPGLEASATITLGTMRKIIGAYAKWELSYNGENYIYVKEFETGFSSSEQVKPGSLIAIDQLDDRASFSGSALTIPLIQVENSIYNVTLSLVPTSQDPYQFQLVAAEEVSRDTDASYSTYASAISYTSFTNGTLSLNGLVVAGITYSVQLALIPNSNPITFEVSSAVPTDSQ